MGGEKSICTKRQRAEQGSPPHGRGKVSIPVSGVSSIGITPAWAGKSSFPLAVLSDSGDHPRMGGEKGVPNLKVNRMPGSPPHGRGKVALAHVTALALGITPAWAGKSRKCTPSQPAGQDHPRMGGEKFSVVGGGLFYTGSPPHGRGKVTWRYKIMRNARITPAWAGKSQQLIGACSLRKDHPRMGGEKGLLQRSGCCRWGSPPHGRGKVKKILSNLRFAGITPAWAGKSFAGHDHHQRPWDHPRMGGEKLRWRLVAVAMRGSPPHGRGKVLFP